MGFRAAVVIGMALALPAYPQHGAAHGGFSGHGASAHVGSMGHGGFSGHGGFAGRLGVPRYSGLFGSQRPSSFSPPGRFPLPGRLQHPIRNGVRLTYAGHPFPDGRHSYRPRYGNGYSHRERYRDHDRDRGHRPSYVGYYANAYPGWYGYPYPYPYVIDPGFYDWSDSGDTGENQGPYPYAPYSDVSGNPEYGEDSGAPPENDYAEAPPVMGRMAARTQARPAFAPAPSPQEPLTVIFKNGRTPEKIQNYIVSASSLTDLDRDHYQKIPLDQIDIAATEQANRRRGINFQVPTTSGD